jgi:hypothetical protein
MYLLIFEDGEMTQFAEWNGGGGQDGHWDRLVRDGVLEIIRFEPQFGNYQRYDPDTAAEWIEI